MTIELRKGDTAQIEVSLTTDDGQPFIPVDEVVMFSVGKKYSKKVYFSVPVEDEIANLTHEMTNSLSPGEYVYDVRVYNDDKTLVATPLYGDFIVKEVANDDL